MALTDMKVLPKVLLVCVAIGLTFAGATLAADEKKASTATLPSAKEVLERYSKAIGGKETFKKARIAARTRNSADEGSGCQRENGGFCDEAE